MKKYFMTILLVLVIGFSTTAYAGWYNSVSIGATSLKIKDYSKMYFVLDDEGFALDFCNGYKFDELPFRFENQICVSRHYCDSDTVMGFDRLKKDISMYSMSIIENVIFDIAYEKVTPYIGFGIGLHWTKGKMIDYLFDGAFPHEHTAKIKKLVFQGILGAKLPISDYSEMFVEYKYRADKNNKLKEKAVFIGVKTYI